MYATILKGVTILGIYTWFKILLAFSAQQRECCPFASLPFLVSLRYNYLELSLQVVKLKTKSCSSPNFSSSSGVYYYLIKLHQLRNRFTLDIVGNLNARTTCNYSTWCATPCRDREKNYNSNVKMNP